jgi:dienelactone hydrolase
MTTIRAVFSLLLAFGLAAGCGDTSGPAGRDAAVVGGDGGIGSDSGVDSGSVVTSDAGPGDDTGASDPDAWVAPGVDAGSSGAGPDVVGPYTVTMSTTMRTGYTAVAWVPTLASGAHAPLVVFKHGYQLASSNYAMLLERIASHGFVVVGVNTSSSFVGGPTNVDERDAMIHAIDWALADAPFAGSVDGAHVLVMGHSRGGKDAVLAAAADTRVTAALLLDPVNGCGPGMGFSATCPDAASAMQAGAIAVPVGVMGETNDGSGGFMPCAPTAQNYATIYAALDAAPWAVQWTFADAVHMTFTDDGGGTFGSFCAMEPTNAAAIRTEIRTMAVAFARYHLRGETEMAAWLTGASVPSDVMRVGP